jgi:hypothetical protein
MAAFVSNRRGTALMEAGAGAGLSVDTTASTDPETQPAIHAERGTDTPAMDCGPAASEPEGLAGSPYALPIDPADRGRRARRQGAWLLGPKVRTVLLAVLAVLVIVLLVRPHATANPADFSVLATEVNAAMTAQPEVTQSTGGYLPGTGIVLVSSVKGVENSQLDAILAKAITASADPIATLPDGEAVSWQVTSTGAAGSTTQLVRVGAADVLDQTRWLLVPVVANVGSTGAAASGAATVSVSPAATASAAAPLGTAPTSASPAASAGDTAAAAAAGSAPAATGATGAATGTAAPAAAGTGALTDDFSTDSKNWSPLTGTWKVASGAYQQSDNSGFDFISQFKTTPPAAFTLSVKMRGLADSLNAGIMIGQPKQGSRNGATIVDLSSKDYVRWGSYDITSGTDKFIGGASLGSAQDLTTQHTLALTIAAASTTVAWDGAKVGSFAAVSAGFVGLVTSQSAVEFDDLTVTAT